MVKPSSFSTICTSNCAFELVGLLLSLSVYHTNEQIYILCDSETKKIIDKLTPQLRLQITWFVELDEYTGLNRQMMEQKGIWSDFQMAKANVIKYALNSSTDTLFLDSDIILTDIINDIDIEKELGISPQFITQEHIDKTGYYNGGVLWTKNKKIPDDWIKFTKTSRYYDQASIEDLSKKYSFFEFGENYNLQCWRYYLSPGGSQSVIKSITSIPNDKLYYNNKPLKFVHTHFLDQRFNDFNQYIIQHLMNAKMYKVLAIIYRVINKKWQLIIPKQPIHGLGHHKNDSYRELPILMKLQNTDVDVVYNDKTIHCWLAPNILTYDRPTLEWYNQEVNNCSLFLLGNGDTNVEGKQLQNNLPNIHVKPWIFWPRKPMLLEKLLKTHGILDYTNRNINSIFIGNFENSVQEKFRKTEEQWDKVLTEYHCTKGQQHKFTHEEYLMKLRDARYGLCLRGYGSKCHREVELMAFGTVPVITPNVCVESYMEPLIENTHYIKVISPEDFNNKIRIIPQKKWEVMSNACYEWYQRNVHSKNCWNNMINHILYNFDTQKENIICWGASVTQQPNGYVDKLKEQLTSYNIIKCPYGGMHLKDAGCFFIDEIIHKQPKYCMIDFFGTGYIETNENTKLIIENIIFKFYKNNIIPIVLIFPREYDTNELTIQRINFIKMCTDIFTKYNVCVLDLCYLFDTYKTNDLLKDAVHTNNNGANIFANEIAVKFNNYMKHNELNNFLNVKMDLQANKFYDIKCKKINDIIYDFIEISGNGEIYSVYQHIGPHSPCVDITDKDDNLIKKELIWDKHCAYERTHFNLSNILVDGNIKIKINNDLIDYNLCNNKIIEWNTYKKCIKPIAIYYSGNIQIVSIK